MHRFDVLIIGSGLSAATLALSLPERLSVAVVTKKAESDSSSYWAQGGIAAVTGPDDSLTNTCATPWWPAPDFATRRSCARWWRRRPPPSSG